MSKEKLRRAVAVLVGRGAVIPVYAGEKKAEQITREDRGFFHRVAQARVGMSKEGSMRTIQEIEASYGEKAAGTAQGWYETQDEIDREIEPVERPHADLFTAQQRAGAARTQKAERAQAKAEEHCKEHRDSSHILLCHHLMTPGGCIPIG